MIKTLSAISISGGRTPSLTAATLITIATLMFGPEARAQTSDESPNQIEEVIVTAQKREQNLIDVPLSISAVTSQTLEDRGFTGVQDLARLAPGLVFAETIGRQTTEPAIRGVAPFGFADPTVAVMIDGYTSGFPRSGNNATLLELERIEVLRGPQATLYGRNAIGGVINYITKKPSNEFRSNLRLDVGAYETYLAQGSVSGPLVKDTFYAGLALGYREFGGFLDNETTGQKDVNDEQDINARLNLRYTPTEALELNLTFDYNEADDDVGDASHAYAGAWLSSEQPTLVEVGAGLFDFNNYDRTINRLAYQLDTQGFVREEETAVLDIAYDLGWATLSGISGISKQDTSVMAPINRLSVSPFDFDVQWDIESWSQELRLASQGEGRFQWLIGGYYFDNKRERRLFLNFDGEASIYQLFSRTTDEVTNKAAFANAQYQLTDAVTLSGGLRYDIEDRTKQNLLGNLRASSTEKELLPSASISYKRGDNTNFYATISRGYHAGGPNEFGAIAVGAPDTYKSELLTNYEVGVKGTLADAAFGYEVALFYMDWTDQQVFTELNVLTRFINNAGSSEIWGLEASARYEPIRGLSLAASLSVLNAEYTDFFDPINSQPYGLDPQLAGNKLIYSSEISGTASAQYLRPIGGGGWDMRLRADVSHVGKRPFDVANLFFADAYSILDLYAGIQNERFEIGVFANNALDEDYLTGWVVPTVSEPAFATVGDPRIVGARFRMRF